jgi:hypothetical protein
VLVEQLRLLHAFACRHVCVQHVDVHALQGSLRDAGQLLEVPR